MMYPYYFSVLKSLRACPDPECSEGEGDDDLLATILLQSAKELPIQDDWRRAEGFFFLLPAKRRYVDNQGGWGTGRRP